MKLSVRQIAVLKILAGTASAEWSRGCGWAYGGPKETDTILMSLTRHGHVERIGDEPGFTPGYLGRYRITDAGRAAVDALTTKETPELADTTYLKPESRRVVWCHTIPVSNGASTVSITLTEDLWLRVLDHLDATHPPVATPEEAP